MDFNTFLQWEKSTRDTIDVKKIYIDLVGDLVTGIVLSQIIYWYLPKRNGESKLRIQREGEWWIRKARTEWWDECRITPKQADRAIEKLIEKGLLEKDLFAYRNKPTVHIRLLTAEFMKKLEAQIQGIISTKGENDQFDQRSKCNLTKGENVSTSETTAETTAEITTSPAAAGLVSPGSKEPKTGIIEPTTPVPDASSDANGIEMTRRPRVTDAQRAGVLRLWHDGLLTQRQIAVQVGIHYVTVHKIIADEYYRVQRLAWETDETTDAGRLETCHD